MARASPRGALALIGVVVFVVAAAIVGYEVLKRPADVHNEAAIRHFEPEEPTPPPKTVHGKPRTLELADLRPRTRRGLAIYR